MNRRASPLVRQDVAIRPRRGTLRDERPQRQTQSVTSGAPITAELELGRRALRTPRAAGIAGIAFAILFTIALVSVRLVVPVRPSDAGRWLSQRARRDEVLFALAIIPFAGIAFLWFIGVVRDRVGESEDRFFATVFLGSGLLFTAMLFASAATAAGLVATAGSHSRSLLTSGAWAAGRYVTDGLMDIAMRMAGVFAIASSTILLRTGAAPRWLAVAGYASAVLLLLAVSLFAWIQLLFPVWVLVVSGHILVAGFKRPRPRKR